MLGELVRRPRAKASRAAPLSVAFCAFCASCVSVQDFGTSPDTIVPADARPPALDPSSDAAPGTWRWEWANPAPTGNALYAVNGTSDEDIWVAGDGTIAHWNGKAWDQRRLTRDGTRYFALGVRGPNDVWAAGGTKDQTRVIHFDGTAWTESYPFAGAAFGGFSHGAGKRLFAIVNLGLLELSPEGLWRQSAGGPGLLDRGPVVDVWVTPSDDAWAVTTGALQPATLLHVEKGSQAWERAAPDLPAQAHGLAISGAGSFGCAFYTGPTTAPGGTRDGLGLLFYDQQRWQVGIRATASAFENPSVGATSACLRGGLGYIVGERDVLEVSLDGKVDKGPRTELGILKHAAWSFDGRHGYVVGDRGLVLKRAWDAGKLQDWDELGTTIRNDLHDVDVGLDGAVLAVDSLRTVIPRGGEVLSWESRWKRISDPVARSGPRLPVAVTVLGAADAWIASDEDGRVGVTHFTGGWSTGATPLEGTGGARQDALAIWAPAENDVWVTGRERCPDEPQAAGKPCSTALASFAAHFDGSRWSTSRTEGAYLAIHGTGPSDVWFAGEGVAHWDGHTLTPVSAVAGRFTGAWSSVKGRVWFWGEHSVLYDGATTIPVEKALNAAVEWKVAGIAESTAGDVFVLTTRSTGTTLLWFDPSRTRLVEQISSDLTLTRIRGRDNHLWAIGEGGASLRFTPPTIR